MTTVSKSARPLLIQEVPAELRPYYNFGTQKVARHRARSVSVMQVERTCKFCGKKEWTRVNLVRQAMRKKEARGICRSCVPKTPRTHRTGKNSTNWKGGKFISNRGYIMVRSVGHPYTTNKYIFEHRLVMEKHLRRYLLPSETVHHKNGIKTDNRLENLELWSRQHSDGQRYAELSTENIKKLIVELQTIIAARPN